MPSNTFPLMFSAQKERFENLLLSDRSFGKVLLDVIFTGIRKYRTVRIFKIFACDAKSQKRTVEIIWMIQIVRIRFWIRVK